MNNAVKGLMGLSIFGAGVGTGWLIAKKHYEKVVELKESWKKQDERLRENYNDIGDEESEDKDHDVSKDYTDDVPYSDDPFHGMSKEEIEDAREHHRRVTTDYTKYYQAKPSLDEVAMRARMSNGGPLHHEVDEDEPEEFEDAETDEEREIREGEALGRVNHEYPYIIEPEQFDTECEHYDKIDLFYYVKDDTLIDENDSPVDDTEDYLDAIAQLQHQTNVYVRNERIGADYALHRLNRSYNEDVLGIAETPREREFRHLARRKSVLDGDE